MFYLKRKMGLFSLTALVAGTMVGSGIFILPAELARIGSISLLSWTFTTIGAFCLAIVFARMSSILPKAGGPYAYTQAGFGNFLGYQTAFYYWLALWVGNAGLAVASLGYLSMFFPFLAHPYVGTIVAILLLWIFTLINLKGIKIVGITQIIMVIIEFLPLVILILFGWHYFRPEYITNYFNVSSQTYLSAFSRASALTLWAFIGIETATIPADLVHNPRHTIPIATLLGTLIAATIYVVGATLVMGMVPHDFLINSTAPFALAISIIFGKTGAWLTAIGAIVSCLGSMNGWILLQGQIPLAAAKDGLFPRIFAKRNIYDVPANALIISSIFASVLLIFTTGANILDQFSKLILITDMSVLIIYFFTSVSAMMVFSKYSNKPKVGKYSFLIATITAAYCFCGICGSGQGVITCVTILGLCGVPMYAWLQYKNSSLMYDIDAYQNDL